MTVGPSGRAAKVGHLQPGELALYRSKGPQKYSLCFSVKITAEFAQFDVGSHAIFAQRPDKGSSTIINVNRSGWKNVDAWVAPPSFRILPNFGSLSHTDELSEDDLGQCLFPGKDGEVFLPVYGTDSFGFHEHLGWIDLVSMSFQHGDSLNDSRLVFREWTIVVDTTNAAHTIWKPQFKELAETGQ